MICTYFLTFAHTKHAGKLLQRECRSRVSHTQTAINFIHVNGLGEC